MAAFEIVSKRCNSKCLIFIESKEDNIEGSWKRGIKTCSGVLTIGGKSGKWIYVDKSKALAIYKEGTETPILAMVNVPPDFLENGKTPTGYGSILLPDLTVEKERIEWKLLEVHRH